METITVTSILFKSNISLKCICVQISQYSVSQYTKNIFLRRYLTCFCVSMPYPQGSCSFLQFRLCIGHNRTGSGRCKAYPR